MFFFDSYGTTYQHRNDGIIEIAGGRKGARNLKEITVKVYDNDIEKAIRILKKKIQNDGLFKRLKLKKSYEKPSEFRRRKQREALRRERIAAARRAYRR
jgi:small subunit ribosomal protein S21